MIELSHVTKSYAPRLGPVAHAVDDVSLRAAAGEVAGISGPAGAGKSTIVAMILGYVRPTTGTVRVDGVEPRRFVEREGIAYLPDRIALPSRWRVADALQRLAVLSGVPAAGVRERVDAVLEALALSDQRKARLRALSPDARTRLGIAQALVAERRVVVLDEPLEGLSAESRLRLHDVITRLRAPDRAILIASRHTDALHQLADRVTVIERGRVRRVGAPRPTTPAHLGTVFHLLVHEGGEHVSDVFPAATSVGRTTFVVRVSGLAELNRGLRELLGRGALLASVAPVQGAAEAAPLVTHTEVAS